MKSTVLICLILPLILTACVTPEESARRQAAQQQAYRNALSNQCQAYGFRPSTDAFAMCIQTEHNKAIDQVNAQSQAEEYRRNSYYCNQGVAQACRAIGR